MLQVDMQTCTATLKSVTYRLTATPSKSLPRVAAQLASSLWNCRQLLSLPTEGLKQNSDIATTVTRFRTQLASLLQDRTVEGRWAAVVLVKATIEAGGAESLSRSNAWVKNLLTILRKPDPPTTRILAVITLTRIFTLTWDHTNLVREITTPALPGFISTCLSNAENGRCSVEEVETILEAFITLIHRHPTIFRTTEPSLRVLFLNIVSNTDTHRYFTHEHRKLANRVLVLLHHCAPKQGSAEHWAQSFKNIVASAHMTCDHLFRAIVEDWRSTAGVVPSAQALALVSGKVELEHDQFVGLTGWSGVSAGGERLIALLSMLETHIDTATTASLTVRLGLLSDLLGRILNASIREGVKLNTQIAKDERDVLFTSLPSIHVAVMQLITALLTRFGRAVLSMVQPLFSPILWIFQTEKYDAGVRSAAYIVTKSVLELQGLSINKGDVADLEAVMKNCCEDLAPKTNVKPSVESSLAKTSDEIGNASSDASNRGSMVPVEVSEAAGNLLPVLIANVNPSHTSRRLRAQLERTAVLSANENALLACVLSPMNAGNRTVTQPSLLPVLARQFPASTQTEVLLRPRMPVIRVERKAMDAMEDLEDDGDGEPLDSEPILAEEVLLDDNIAVENETLHNSDDTPPNTTHSASTPIMTSSLGTSRLIEKRPAPREQVEFSPDITKRPRTSPGPREAMSSNALSTFPAETALSIQPGTASDVVSVAFERAIVAPAATLTPPPQFAQNHEEEDDDDAEMEIPTLTMEDSSDDEE